MGAKKITKKSAKVAKTDAIDGSFAVVLEDLRGQFTVFGEALQGLREHMERRFDAVDKRFDAVDKRFDAVDKRFELADRRFDSVERQLGLLTDAVRTHSKALQAIETKLDGHEARVSKLEGAAE